MPYVENVDDLAEALADAVGMWGEGCPEDGAHGCPLDRWCRLCWTIHIKERIRQAVKNEEKTSHEHR